MSGAPRGAPEGAAALAYDLVGNRVRRTAANGVVTDALFDLRRRPTAIVHRAPGGATLASFATAFSPSGRRTSSTEADGSVETFGYDARGRLVSETRTGTHPYAIAHASGMVGPIPRPPRAVSPPRHSATR